MTNSCTMVINSYDGGEDLWEGLFTTLAAQWPGCDLPIVLNTESKSYSFPGFAIRTLSLYPAGKKVPWGRQLLETLKYIDSEYILLFQDDFWLDAPVDTDFFAQCLRWMEDNSDVAVLSFQRVLGPNIRDNRFERFERRPQKGEYRFNCQAAIWRKSRLVSALRPHEDPWQWETIANKYRSPRMKDGFYTLINGEKPVFSYSRGGVVRRGKWDKKVILPLVEQYGFCIDFSKRGFLVEPEKFTTSPSKRATLLYRLSKPDLFGRILRRIISMRSFF